METKPNVPKDAAVILLSRKNRNTTLLQNESVKRQLGQAGFREALNRRWVEVDDETGMLSITSNASRLNEMRRLAESTEPEKSTYRETPAIMSGREYVPLQAEASITEHRHNVERMQESAPKPTAHAVSKEPSWRQFVLPQESWKRMNEGDTSVTPAMRSGGSPSSAPAAPATSVTSTQTAPPKSPDASKPDMADIGDTVTIAEGGKPYQAVVQSKKPDGSLVLSFGASKPGTTRDYKSAEVKVIKKADTQPTNP